MEANSRRLKKETTMAYFISPCWISTDRFINSVWCHCSSSWHQKISNPKQEAKYFKTIINIKNNKATNVRTHSDDHCFQLNSWPMIRLGNWHRPSYSVVSLCQLSGNDHRYSDMLCCQPWIGYCIGSHTACGPYTVGQATCSVMDELTTPWHCYGRAEATLHLFNSLYVRRLYIPNNLIKLSEQLPMTSEIPNDLTAWGRVLEKQIAFS